MNLKNLTDVSRGLKGLPKVRLSRINLWYSPNLHAACKRGSASVVGICIKWKFGVFHQELNFIRNRINIFFIYKL